MAGKGKQAMIKAIGYAYASSTIAARLGAARDGCYYVATYQEESEPIADDLIGPFATIEEAETCAASVAGSWSRFTRRDT